MNNSEKDACFAQLFIRAGHCDSLILLVHGALGFYAYVLMRDGESVAAAASRVGLTCGRATAIGPLPVPARASAPAAIGRSTAAVFQFSTAAARPVVIRGGSREGR